MSWRVPIWGMLVGLLLLRPPPTHAHAFLDHAEPRVGSSVDSPPDTPAPEHPAPDVLRVALPSLAPGEYTVHWAVVSVDTHPTEGHFTFSVKKPRS